MRCLISGMANGRAPGVFAHDSHLFGRSTPVKSRPVSNIGALLAEQYDFQYIVTLNSDFLDSVVKESHEVFDPGPCRLQVRLTDESQERGLFEFRFE